MAQPKFFPKLPIDKIDDLYVREGFKTIQEFFKENTPLFGFQHYVLSVPSNGDGLSFSHNLGYLPEDLLVTNVKNGTIVFSYEDFTKDKIFYSATGIVEGTPCEIRFFLGSYVEAP